MNTLKLLETELKILNVLGKSPSSADRLIREVPGINNMRAIQRYIKDIKENFNIHVVFDHKTGCYRILSPDVTDWTTYVLKVIKYKVCYPEVY